MAASQDSLLNIVTCFLFEWGRSALATCGSFVFSHGQLVAHGLALLNGLKVVVKEVDVEAGLQDCSQRLCPAEKSFHLVAVNPTHTVHTSPCYSNPKE